LLTPPPLIPISSQPQPVPPSYNNTGKVLLDQLSQSLTSPTFQTLQKKELQFHNYSGPKQVSTPAYLGQSTNSNIQENTYSKQGTFFTSKQQQRGKTSPRTYFGPKKHSTPKLRSTHTTRQTPKQQRGQVSPQTYTGPKRLASSASHDGSSSRDYGRNYGSINGNYKSFPDDFPRGDYPSHDKSYQSNHDHNGSYRSSLDHDESYRSSQDAEQSRSYTLSLDDYQRQGSRFDDSRSSQDADQSRNYTLSLDDYQRQGSRFDDSRSSRDHPSSSGVNGRQYTSPRELPENNLSSDFYKIVAANALLSGYTPVRSDRHYNDYYYRR